MEFSIGKNSILSSLSSIIEFVGIFSYSKSYLNLKLAYISISIPGVMQYELQIANSEWVSRSRL